MVLIVGSCQHGKHGIDCIECYRLSYADAQDEVKRLNLQVHELQEIVAEFVEGGEIDLHEEDPKCPQDDTCSCARAKKLNAAMRGYTEKPIDAIYLNSTRCVDCGASLTDGHRHPVEKPLCEGCSKEWAFQGDGWHVSPKREHGFQMVVPCSKKRLCSVELNEGGNCQNIRPCDRHKRIEEPLKAPEQPEHRGRAVFGEGDV